jgi:two-component system cell cycle sensor histidine kinase/response regulator CckA
MSKYQFQKRLMHLHQQISEFEKLDIEHRRTKSITWLETEEKYRYMLEQTEKNACIIQDAKIRLITQNFSELLGYSPEELIDTLMIRYIHPDELPKLIKYYMSRMAGEDVPPVYKTILKHKDGSDIFVEINAGLIPYRGNPADFAVVKCLTKKN